MSAPVLLRLVADTNVVVSANLKPAGAEALVMRLAFNHRVQLYISPSVLAEYITVLSRPHFRFVPTEIERFLLLIQQASIVVEPTTHVAASPDESDNRFLECAAAAQADVLVTGNKRHFPARWHTADILNAREFIDRLGPIIFPVAK